MTNQKYKIGLSNILTIVVCLVTVGIAYGQAQTRIDELERRVEDYEIKVLPLLYEVKEEVQGIKVQQAKIATDIEWMKNNSVNNDK